MATKVAADETHSPCLVTYTFFTRGEREKRNRKGNFFFFGWSNSELCASLNRTRENTRSIEINLSVDFED